MKNKTLTPWKRFLGLLQLERKDILNIAYFAIFEGIVALSLPLGIQAIINLLQSSQITASWIVLIVLVTLGVAFSGGLKLMQMRVIETIQQRIFTRASLELSYRFPKIKMSELRKHYLPEIANRFFDTLTIQKGLSKILIDFPSAILKIIFALVLLSFYHPFFIFFGIALIALGYIVFRYTAQRGLEASLMESKYKYKVAHWLQEIARTVISFKVSGKTNLALEKTDKLVSGYLDARENHFRVLVLQYKKMIGFKLLVTAGLLLIGGFLVLNQQMNIGQFVAAEIIILLVVGSVEKLILGLESYYDVLTSIEKLGQVVDQPLEAQEGETSSSKNGLTIELQNASYEVEERNIPILKEVSLTIHPSDRILIEGDIGSGKLSLLQLIAGVISPSSGYVFINNLSIESLRINSYRADLGLSFSNETPFEGTIRENITFGDPSISDEFIFEIFETVGLIDFIKQQPNGLNTILKPEGKQIGYTIAKKIILTRAIAKRPKVLILENPLDQFETKEANRIIVFLADKKQPWSLVVVSQNETWKHQCDKHIVLKKGSIVELKSEQSC
ncbi:MAG: ABC transporter ATP-binding protein/permease [Flavobacteriales bacterium]|nr:MAG: ABC transporter ATP-binding protein/permease [Flavobacteriales bacterium]